jgi:hypothetical protein
MASLSHQTIKTATHKNEPVFMDSNGSSVPYIPKEIVGHREAYAVTLNLLFKHIADFHTNMIAIIAEKYNLDAAEMIGAVCEDPRYQQMLQHPVIESMGYFSKEDLAKQIPAAPTPAPAVVAEVAAEVAPEPKKVVMKLKKKKTKAEAIVAAADDGDEM